MIDSCRYLSLSASLSSWASHSTARILGEAGTAHAEWELAGILRLRLFQLPSQSYQTGGKLETGARLRVSGSGVASMGDCSFHRLPNPSERSRSCSYPAA